MKQLLFLLFFVQFSAIAQCDPSSVLDFPDVEPQFPGGPAAMKKFITDNIVYPDIEELAETGRVYVEFIVCGDGSLVDIHGSYEMHPELEQMAINLVQKMPKWIPAELKGKPVSSRYRFPILIHLN